MATINSLVLSQLVNENVRTPDLDWTLDANGDPVANYSVPLTVAEQARYADCVAMARSPFLSSMTFAEYQALKPFLATEATWVQASRNAFVQDFATDINQRRLLFDALTAVIRVQRALMRQ